VAPRLLRENERLGNGGDVQRHDHLVRQLGDIAGAQITDMHDG